MECMGGSLVRVFDASLPMCFRLIRTFVGAMMRTVLGEVGYCLFIPLDWQLRTTSVARCILVDYRGLCGRDRRRYRGSSCSLDPCG